MKLLLMLLFFPQKEMTFQNKMHFLNQHFLKNINLSLW